MLSEHWMLLLQALSQARNPVLHSLHATPMTVPARLQEYSQAVALADARPMLRRDGGRSAAAAPFSHVAEELM